MYTYLLITFFKFGAETKMVVAWHSFAASVTASSPSDVYTVATVKRCDMHNVVVIVVD